MKLLYSATSPYARKVRLVLLEKSDASKVEVMEVNTQADTDKIRAINPLGKIPALVMDNGEALFDSPVICAYLDDLLPGPKLIPVGDEGWRVRCMEALADGMLDAMYNIVMETRRPENERSPGWVKHWQKSALRGCDAAEAFCAALPDDHAENVDLGRLALVAALGYADLRMPDIGWRDGRQNLAKWYEDINRRESVQQTAPPAA